jgi:DNA repair protein RecO (recombination protein O)
VSLQTSEAIVLRSYNSGEQDKIVVLFTREKGIIKGIAKGARKFVNRFGGSLEPFSHIKIIYYEKETRELVVIKNCELIESFFEIQKDVKVIYYFSYFAELIEEFFPLKSVEELSYRLLISTFKATKGGGDLNLISRYFEMWLLKIYGILPDFSKCMKCRKKIIKKAWLSPKRDGVLCNSCSTLKRILIIPAIHSFIEWARKNPPTATENINFSFEELKLIGNIFQEIIIYHLEKVPKTLSLLK